MNRAAAIALALVACRHGAPPPETASPLWARAELVIGRGDRHLPLPARALVALEGGRALALLDDGGLAEIDLARGESIRQARAALDGRALAATRLADGRVLAVGAGAARERAWWIDAAHLSARAVDVTGATGGDAVFDASGVAAAPDGRALVITGVRLPLALRDARDLSITRELSPERNWSHPVFVADSYLVAWHHGELVAFDLATGHSAGRWPTTTGFASPDGLAVVHAPDVIHLELTDLHAPDYKVALSSQDPIDVAWSPDGRHVVVVDPDRVITYAIPGGDSRAVALPGAVSRAVFSTDGRELVISARGALWRVDPATGRAAGPTGPGAGAIAFVAPLASGGVVMQSDRWRVVDRDGGLRASGGWRGLAAGGFALSPDGGRVAAASIGGDEAFVEAWDAGSGRSLVSAVSDDALVAVDVGDDGTIVAAMSDGIERLGADRTVQVLARPRWAPPLDLAAGAARVVYGRAGALVVTDLTASRAIATAVAFDCDGDATARLSRDGARLAVVTGDRLAVWAVGGDAGAAAITARLPGPVRTLAIGRGGVIAAVGDRLILWDPDAGRTAARAIATPAAVTAIGLAAAGDRVALGFGDGRAGVWRIAELRALAAPLALGDAGALPATCPGDPLAPAGTGGEADPDHHHLQPLAQP